MKGENDNETEVKRTWRLRTMVETTKRNNGRDDEGPSPTNKRDDERIERRA